MFSATMHVKWYSAESHWAFSSKLFHGQITQKYIDQMNAPENERCRRWKVFELPPPNPAAFELSLGEALVAWTHGCLDIKLAQKCHFSNFCKKSFLAWQKSSCTFLDNFGSFNLQKSCSKTFRFIQRVQEISFVKPGNFFCRNLKNAKWHFWANVKSEDSLTSGQQGPLLLKSLGVLG